MTITGRRGFDINHPHGSIYYGIGDSALNAAPYALLANPQAIQHTCRIVLAVQSVDRSIFLRSITAAPRHSSSSITTASVGRIPSTSFRRFPRCWSGKETSRRRPTHQAQRRGNRSRFSIPRPTLFMQTTRSRRSIRSQQDCCPTFRMPNLPGDFQNFHFVTSATSDSDDLNVRINHTFGAAPAGGRRGGRGGAAQQPHLRPSLSRIERQHYESLSERGRQYQRSQF